ncbi:hypothetical protein DAI22_07g247100 [Oryza sativa Japonica Group]|nr:hypothetical protein DAI22_07g247100 [Oryza sativa Japonica Group]
MPVMIGFSPSFLKAPLQFEAGRAQANFAVHRQLFVATARSSVGGIDDGMHGQMSCAAHMTGCRRPVHRPRRGEDVRARGIYQFCLDLMSLASSISLDRRLTALCQVICRYVSGNHGKVQDAAVFYGA